MIRQVVLASDFKQISETYPYFFWNFLQKNQTNSPNSLFSYFEERLVEGVKVFNPVVEIFDSFQNLPYFESEVHNSMDLLMDLGFSAEWLYNPKQPLTSGPRHYKYYRPVFVGFFKKKRMWSTAETCYCSEGLLEVIEKTYPDFYKDFKN